MSKNEEIFGEIRSTLQDTPSEQGWQQLAQQLSTIKDQSYLTDVVLPYVGEYLEKWPETIWRIAPQDWVKPVLKKNGVISPLISLANGLELKSCRIGPKSAPKIFDAEELAHLRYLDLSHNGIKSEGAKLFAASPHFRNLEVLLLRDARIGDSGAEAMARSENVAKLTQLDMTGSNMSSEGCSALQHSSKLAKHLRDRAFDWIDEERDYYQNGWE